MTIKMNSIPNEKYVNRSLFEYTPHMNKKIGTIIKHQNVIISFIL